MQGQAPPPQRSPTEAEMLAIYEQHPSTHRWLRIFDYINVLDSGGVGDLAYRIGTEDPGFNIALQLVLTGPVFFVRQLPLYNPLQPYRPQPR